MIQIGKKHTFKTVNTPGLYYFGRIRFWNTIYAFCFFGVLQNSPLFSRLSDSIFFSISSLCLFAVSLKRGKLVIEDNGLKLHIVLWLNHNHTSKKNCFRAKNNIKKKRRYTLTKHKVVVAIIYPQDDHMPDFLCRNDERRSHEGSYRRH